MVNLSQSMAHSNQEQLHVSVSQFRRWRWEGYVRHHQSRVNILLHFLVAPCSWWAMSVWSLCSFKVLGLWSPSRFRLWLCLSRCKVSASLRRPFRPSRSRVRSTRCRASFASSALCSLALCSPMAAYGVSSGQIPAAADLKR